MTNPLDRPEAPPSAADIIEAHRVAAAGSAWCRAQFPSTAGNDPIPTDAELAAAHTTLAKAYASLARLANTTEPLSREAQRAFQLLGGGDSLELADKAHRHQLRADDAGRVRP